MWGYVEGITERELKDLITQKIEEHFKNVEIEKEIIKDSDDILQERGTFAIRFYGVLR